MAASDQEGAAFLTGLVIGMILGLGLGGLVIGLSWRNEALENNCGHYNTKTGSIEWNTVVPEKN